MDIYIYMEDNTMCRSFSLPWKPCCPPRRSTLGSPCRWRLSLPSVSQDAFDRRCVRDQQWLLMVVPLGMEPVYSWQKRCNWSYYELSIRLILLGVAVNDGNLQETPMNKRWSTVRNNTASSKFSCQQTQWTALHAGYASAGGSYVAMNNGQPVSAVTLLKRRPVPCVICSWQLTSSAVTVSVYFVHMTDMTVQSYSGMMYDSKDCLRSFAFFCANLGLGFIDRESFIAPSCPALAKKASCSGLVLASGKSKVMKIAWHGFSAGLCLHEFFPTSLCGVLVFHFVSRRLARLTRPPRRHTTLTHQPSFTHHFVNTIFHTQLYHTPSITHNFVTHHLSHTTLSHTPSITHNFVTHHLSHTIFVTHHLSHTTLSHTIFHTQLCQSLSHTIFHRTIFVTYHFSHTHIFVTHHLSPHHLSHTIFVTHIFVTHHLSPHHLSHTFLSHTTLSHTIFHTPSLSHTIFHTPLSYAFIRHLSPHHLTPTSFTHIFVTHHLSPHHLSHNIFVTHNFAWQAWHLVTSTFVSRRRRGTWRHLPSFHVAGVALRALGWIWWRAWARIGRRWCRGTLRGRHGAWRHLPSFRVAGVTLKALAWLWWRAWARIGRRWRRGTLRGRPGTWWHLPSFHVAGVALGDIYTFVSRGRRGT